MRKPKRKASRLTTKSTDEEIVRWTKSHDVFDRLETGISEVVKDHSDLDEILREAIFQDNTTQLNMRLPPAMKAVLSKLARQHDGRDDSCSDMACGTAGARTQSGMIHVR